MSEDWKNDRAEAAMREGTEAIRKAAEEKAKQENRPIRRVYTDFNEFLKNEPDAVKSLIKTVNNEKYSDSEVLMTYDYNWNTGKKTDRPMNSIDDLIGVLRDIGDGEEQIDSLYITVDYESSTYDGKYGFIVTGSSYRKDQSICDEEMEENFTVIDLERERIEEEEKKKNKKAQELSKSVISWNNFFENKSLEELKAELLKYKFPSLIK